MGFLARPGFSFFVLFSRSLPLGWGNSIAHRQPGRYLFGSFSAVIFGRKRREKIKKKKRMHRLTAAIGKTKGNRINTGVKPKNNRKKKREQDGRKRTKRWPENSIEKKTAFLIPDLYWEKKKKKKRKKGCWKRERRGMEKAERSGYWPKVL